MCGCVSFLSCRSSSIWLFPCPKLQVLVTDFQFVYCFWVAEVMGGRIVEGEVCIWAGLFLIYYRCLQFVKIHRFCFGWLFVLQYSRFISG